MSSSTASSWQSEYTQIVDAYTIRLTPARRAASSTATVPRALTRSASSGSAWTSLTSATAARWATASQLCSARSSASRSVIEPSTVSTVPGSCHGEGRRS